jgi:hypothetical protein
MNENESYKYLGMQRTRGIEHKHIKETLKKKFFKRVEAVLKKKLSEKHIIKAINTYSELSTEIKDQWKMDTVATIPITLSTNGIIPKTLHKALNTLSLHPNTFIELQKATILNTCSIVRKCFNIS